MIKINSELPNCLLDKNNTINEYDFVLYHLYSTNNKYKNYYLEQRFNNPNRLMILDNSAYEFFIKGEELDLEKFIDCIFELKPDFYILPDTLMNKEKTLNDTIKFMFLMTGKGKSNSKPLAVAQGKTSEEMLQCAEQYNIWGIENIAIPFHNSFFKEIGLHCDEDIENEFASTYNIPVTEDMLYAMGRIQFVRKYNDILKEFKHVHFLGSHCPLEKMYYNDFHTMDTGYPVKLAMVGDLLFEEKSKPNIIIDDFINDELDIETKELIEINVEKFKKI